MAEAYEKRGSRKTEELGELDQFMGHHLDEEQDEVRLRFSEIYQSKLEC
jgi:hypothetical protein